MSKDNPLDSPSVYFQIVVILFALMITLSIFTLTGLDSIFFLSLNGATGNSAPATLDDYAAIDSIEFENETVVIQLTENPQLEANGIRGNDITHVQLTRSDGAIQERVSREDGVLLYEFTTPTPPDGNYTLTLLNYHPQDPGLFGEPERYDRQHIEFRVENGTITNITVPQIAKHE